MFEKIGRLAEKAATNVDVSRRGFLGRLGKSALAVAGVLGFAASTAEGGKYDDYTCCRYTGPDGSFAVCRPHGSKCTHYAGYHLRQTKLSSCFTCF